MNMTKPINTNNVARNKAFDVLKLFAIFLVVWGHCIQNLHSGDFYSEPVYKIIYSFHMPLFMVISGFFSKSAMSFSGLAFFNKKFTWGGYDSV